MEAPAAPLEISSSKNASYETALTKASVGQDWDLGPEPESLSWLQFRKFILKYVVNSYGMEMIIMLLVLAGITAGVLYWDELRPPSVVQIQSSAQAPISSSWAEWVTYLQSFLGLGTLFIAFLIWYAETNDNWENNLPKRMSIFFFYDEHPVIVCRCVWLASAGDLRAWGQQVAAQAAGKRLDFSPDIKALQPHPVIWPAGTVCNHYAVRFNLTRHPFGTENFGICLYQNMASDKKGVYPIPVSRIETLSAVNEWQSGAKKM